MRRCVLETSVSIRSTCRVGSAHAELLEGFAHHEVVARCPAELCGVELYVTMQETNLFVNLEDAAAERVVPPPERSLPGPGAWTEKDAIGRPVALARRAGHDALARRLHAVTGEVACPSCRASFLLWDTLLDPSEL